MKVSFLKRILAYIIDLFIINILVSIFGLVIPVSDNMSKLNEELANLSEQYLNQEIDDSTYLSLAYDIEYDLQKESIPISLISVVISILYFVVLPFYNKGQTIGKKLNRIKIVKCDDGKLEMNDLIVRAFINNTILFSLIELVMIIFVKNSDIVMTVSVILTYIQLLILFISLIMIIFTKKKMGIHGIISKTEVEEV